jgi:hypothetical protein
MVCMEEPKSLICEQCGAEAPVISIIGQDYSGSPSQWVKTDSRGDALYVSICCPNCGMREVCIAGDDDFVD